MPSSRLGSGVSNRTLRDLGAGSPRGGARETSIDPARRRGSDRDSAVPTGTSEREGAQKPAASAEIVHESPAASASVAFPGAAAVDFTATCPAPRGPVSGRATTSTRGTAASALKEISTGTRGRWGSADAADRRRAAAASTGSFQCTLPAFVDYLVRTLMSALSPSSVNKTLASSANPPL